MGGQSQEIVNARVSSRGWNPEPWETGHGVCGKTRRRDQDVASPATRRSKKTVPKSACSGRR